LDFGERGYQEWKAIIFDTELLTKHLEQNNFGKTVGLMKSQRISTTSGQQS